MLIKKRLSIAGEIQHTAKFKEKTSPGPCGYDNHNVKLKNYPTVNGNYKQQDKYKHFIDDAQSLSKISHQCPAAYNPLDPVRFPHLG